jgi:outer membrane protein OmpA-like peptidoglycan-associated protein
MTLNLLQRSSRFFWQSLLIVCAAASLGACSSTPQWAKPNTWVDGVFGPSNSTASAPAPAEQQQQQQNFPNLSEVPERPADTSSPAERSQAVDGLVADRANAKHAAETLRGGDPSYAVTTPEVPIEPAAAPPDQPTTQPATQQQPAAEEGTIEGSTEGATPEEFPEGTQTTPPAPANDQRADLSADDIRAELCQGADDFLKTTTLGEAQMANLFALSDEGHNFSLISVGRAVADTRVLSEVSVTRIPSPVRRPVQLISSEMALGAWPAEAMATNMGLPARPTLLVRAPSNELTTAETIYFRDGSTRLGSLDRSRLSRAAKLHSRHGGQIRLIGHASPTADVSPVRLIANFDISLKRAKAVALTLVERGVPPSAIVIEAVGDSAPIYAASIPQSEAFNRRVEILFEDL